MCSSDLNYATVIYDNPCYFDKSYDNPLFVSNFEMHGIKYKVPISLALDDKNHLSAQSDIVDFNVNCSSLVGLVRALASETLLL